MRGYVDYRWGQAHYRASGESGTALVLLHESPQSSNIFESTLPLLGNHLRTYAFDTPGYGLSDPPPVAQEIPDYAKAILEMIDSLGLKKFAIFGSHTGASLALRVALEAPERVTHTIFQGMPAYLPKKRQARIDSWAPPMELAADGSHFQYAWERFRRIWWGEPSLELLTLAVINMASNHERYGWAYNAAFHYDPVPDLPKLGCPTLFITPEHDLLAEEDQRAVGLVPDSRLVLIEGAGGQLYAREPERFAREVTNFLLG